LQAAYRRNQLSAAALIAVAAACSMVMLSAAVPSRAATNPTPAKVAVAQGISAAGLAVKPVFATPAGTRETVSFVLKERNLRGLEARVQRGMRGGYLSERDFARTYGQPPSRVTALERFLAHFGVRTTAAADRLDVMATGTAAQFDKALSVRQHNYSIKSTPASGGLAGRPAVTIHGTTDRPLVPVRLAGFIQSILGLTNYPIFASNAVHTLTAEHWSAPRGLQQGNRTPQSFARQYDLTPLYAHGARGQGQTIGIITYASMRPSDATHFWSSMLRIRAKAGRIRLDNIDGGAGRVSSASGSPESTLDVEQAGALAPAAKIVVYQAPNTDYGAADAFFAAASQDRASTLSTSWGYSETGLKAFGQAGQESATYGAMFDEAYLEMAAQGQTAFASAGDYGAYDDSHDSPQSYANLSVDNPGDSPWVTTTGGTTIAGRIPLYDSLGSQATTVRITAQRTWGWDWLWPHYALFDHGSAPYKSEAQFATDVNNIWGSGGGYSRTEWRPAYQRQIGGLSTYTAVPYLTPSAHTRFPGTNLWLPTHWLAWDSATHSAAPPRLVSGHANGRAVPDLVADADPYTGYEEYFSGFPASLGHVEQGWGGTSFVAPQLNGAAAVIDSYLGHRAGFWNPAIYRFATGPRSPFTPLDKTGAANDNLYYTGTAGHIYNPGSGLGTPDLAKLAADFRARR
jgi:subtilase family serine protease